MQKPYKHYKLPTIDKINVIKITIICTCTYVHINTEDHYTHEHRSFPYQRILIVYQIKVKIRNNFIPPPPPNQNGIVFKYFSQLDYQLLFQQFQMYCTLSR